MPATAIRTEVRAGLLLRTLDLILMLNCGKRHQRRYPVAVTHLHTRLHAIIIWSTSDIQRLGLPYSCRGIGWLPNNGPVHLLAARVSPRCSGQRFGSYREIATKPVTPAWKAGHLVAASREGVPCILSIYSPSDASMADPRLPRNLLAARYRLTPTYPKSSKTRDAA